MITLKLIALAAGASLTALVSAVSGMGGGILLFAFLNLFLSPQTALSLHAFAQLTSNVSRVLVYWEHVSWKMFLPFAIGGTVGVAVAGLVFFSLPERAFGLLIGLFLGAYALFNNRISRSPYVRSFTGRRSFAAIGAVTGFLSMIMGAAGPVLVPFLKENIRLSEESEERRMRIFIATKSMLQVWIQFAKSAAFLFVFSFPLQEYAKELIVLVIFIIIGTVSGRWVLGKIDKRYFDPMLRTAIFLVALKMSVEAIFFGGA